MWGVVVAIPVTAAPRPWAVGYSPFGAMWKPVGWESQGDSILQPGVAAWPLRREMRGGKAMWEPVGSESQGDSICQPSCGRNPRVTAAPQPWDVGCCSVGAMWEPVGWESQGDSILQPGVAAWPLRREMRGGKAMWEPVGSESQGDSICQPSCGRNPRGMAAPQPWDVGCCSVGAMWEPVGSESQGDSICQPSCCGLAATPGNVPSNGANPTGLRPPSDVPPMDTQPRWDLWNGWCRRPRPRVTSLQPWAV
ncbi:MAG: hypothetical protein JST85_15645 [Acidobacteria bacterium]|nr:hypothetical protein [Acidobacteriota bacterium]